MATVKKELAAGVGGKQPKAGMVDPKGAYTKVQERTLGKAKDGKWMQKAAASIKKRGTEGKCTPISKPGCSGRAKSLAKTFKKIAAKRKTK